MIYEFPIIRNISDVLPAIEDAKEFIVAERDGYTVINYMVQFADTFPDINVAGGSAKMRAERSLHNAIRRECRGIIFCSETGNILRRPFQKFFNISERQETSPTQIDLTKNHMIMDKLDGSMLAPFFLGDEIIWATKMAAQDFHEDVKRFVRTSPIDYESFVRTLILTGFTPIFEWISRKTRIVLDYGAEDQLILTGVRNMITGEYSDISGIHWIPQVATFGGVQGNINEFIEHTRDLTDVEGYVLRFADGHMVKIKCDWYVRIHKAREAILHDRNIVELILDNKLDDIKPHLPTEDQVRLEEFEKVVSDRIHGIAAQLDKQMAWIQKKQWDRKTFALSDMAAGLFPQTKSAIFTLWDGKKTSMEIIVDSIRSKLTKNSAYDTLTQSWFEGIKYNV
jgi:RNA ligase